MTEIEEFLNSPAQDLEKDKKIVHEDPLILLWFTLGPICLLSGLLLVSTVSPNYSVGFPLFTIGLSVCIYGLNRYYNVKSSMRLNEIDNRIKEIERIVKQWDRDNNL